VNVTDVSTFNKQCNFPSLINFTVQYAIRFHHGCCVCINFTVYNCVILRNT